MGTISSHKIDYHYLIPINTMKLQLVLAFLTFNAVLAAEKPAEQLRSGKLTRNSQRRAQDGGDNGGDDGICFSAFNNVEVRGKGMVSMDMVQVGDNVRSGKDAFSRVISLAHLDHETEADYLQIHADGLENPLEISHVHMVFVQNKAVRAAEVKVGDMLGENKVSEIKTVKRAGLYAPITEAGELMVNGVRASSYVSYMDYVPLDQHMMTHMFYAPQRMICSFNFVQFMRKCNTFIAPIQLLFSLITLPVVSAMFGIEKMILSPVAPMVVLGYAAYRANSKRTLA